jgi:hypothetical protein
MAMPCARSASEPEPNIRAAFQALDHFQQLMSLPATRQENASQIHDCGDTSIRCSRPGNCFGLVILQFSKIRGPIHAVAHSYFLYC